jgi:demethylmenaquinone methyltransferase/2-methoxy-6-polyprenyl-1,4-benzoquinol methylase
MLDPAPRPSRRGNPVPAAEVRTMFDRIAPIYDAMNTLMTAGVDARWRRAAVDAAGLVPGGRAVDVACGTGALTRGLARAVGPTGSVIGIDASAPMIEQARRHAPAADAAAPTWVDGDALAMPLDDALADATTIAFGLRNVADYQRCLGEMARVTRPGGRVVVLELATPEHGLGRAIALTWFGRVVPLIGRVAGGGSAYRYLPDSVRDYPSPVAVVSAMADAGLRDIRWRRLWPGLVTLHVATRA